jgi:hypothetical protein
MHHLDLAWGLYAGVCKDDDQIYLQLIEYNKAYAESYMKHAGEVIYAKALPPRISDSPGFWKCKGCDFFNTCHNDVIPATNCRTCIHAQPSKISNPPGLWVCNRQQPEIDTQPNKGCNFYGTNTKFFADDIPF